MRAYLVDVLALQLSEEGVETVGIGLNADGLEDSGDVLGRGGGVASELEEEVGSEVLHFECSARWLGGQMLKRKRSVVRREIETYGLRDWRTREVNPI